MRGQDLSSLGPINGPIVGIITKEMVRRVITAIRNKQQVFEVQQKRSYSGTMDDVFTSADTEAQALYLRTITECFPCAGIIAEEDSLNVRPKNKCRAHFTVDPLDGTKAFVRRQSHGVGSMIALVKDNQVISAYVGDVNTKEIYGYRPGSLKVHRITEFNTSEQLQYGKPIPLKKQYVLLRDPPSKYSVMSQILIAQGFKNMIVDGGSIGTWLARLWKREVGAAIIPPSWETPWDTTPIIGISEKLGYKFFRPAGNPIGHWWESFNPVIPVKKYKREHDLLILHTRDAKNLRKFNR